MENNRVGMNVEENDLEYYYIIDYKLNVNQECNVVMEKVSLLLSCMKSNMILYDLEFIFLEYFILYIIFIQFYFLYFKRLGLEQKVKN